MRNTPFLFVLLLFIVGATIQAFTFPLMEGSDEPLHVTYTLHLRDTATLPDRATYLENCARQQSGQPPLPYAIGAALLSITDTPDVSCDAVFDHYFRTINNPWPLTPQPTRRDDNINNFLVTPGVEVAEGFPMALRTLRLLSVGWGALAVFAAWLAAGELFPRRSWRLTAVIFFAFTPTFFHLSGYYTNDTPAVALATLVTWGILRAVRVPVSLRETAAFGVLLGIGGLMKVSVLLLAPVYAFAIVWRNFDAMGRRGPPTIKTLVMIAPTVVTSLVIFGPWMLYGTLTHNDPFGTGTHTHPTLNYDPPLGALDIICGLPEIWRTYVGLLGYANLYLPTNAYWLLGALVALGALGWITSLFRGQRTRRSASLQVGQTIVLGLAALLLFVGFLRFYRVIFDVTGRLLLPGHIVYVAFIVAGLRALGRRLHAERVLQTVAVCVSVTALAYTSTSLYAAYAPRTGGDMPTLQGPSYTFDDTVRLLGYHSDGDTFSDGIHTITLCWEALQPTDREAAYAVRYVKDGIPAAARTTVHGLGTYHSRVW
ncbi:MAG: glycosyltransferase family 39 protein, partial [Chloroflexota bacterium]